jgi:pilus assembly protein Flp/PilA
VLGSFFAKEDGQGLAEYALILVLMAIVAKNTLSLLGGKAAPCFRPLPAARNHRDSWIHLLRAIYQEIGHGLGTNSPRRLGMFGSIA